MITVSRTTGEVTSSPVTEEQRQALWEELIRQYCRKHPEALMVEAEAVHET